MVPSFWQSLRQLCRKHWCIPRRISSVRSTDDSHIDHNKSSVSCRRDSVLCSFDNCLRLCFLLVTIQVQRNSGSSLSSTFFASVWEGDFGFSSLDLTLAGLRPLSFMSISREKSGLLCEESSTIFAASSCVWLIKMLSMSARIDD